MKKTLLFLVGVGLGVLVVAWYFSATKTAAPSTSATPAASSTPKTIVVNVPTPKAATSTVAHPSLTRAAIISSTLAPEVAAAVKTHIDELTATLKKDLRNADAWMDLATYRKIGGDYAGAAEIWSYVGATNPTYAFIAYGNLGDLYMNFVKDYPRSEMNYQKAITLNPQAIDFYRSLFTLYRYSYKTNTTAAADILTQGLKSNPGNPDLLELQKEYNQGV